MEKSHVVMVELREDGYYYMLRDGGEVVWTVRYEDAEGLIMDDFFSLMWMEIARMLLMRANGGWNAND
jgi:hypothetical protein